MTKCGFIAILGVPNAGKSTLTNSLVGSKVSIVSPKVQTTRQRILGIALHEDTQLILMDTPGIFDPKKRLDRAMVKAAWSTGRDADLCVVIVDVAQKSKFIQQASTDILDHLPPDSVTLVLNKIDLVVKEKLLPLIESFKAHPAVKNIFMISASLGDGVEDLRHHLIENVPAGPWMYPAEHITDLPQRLWAAEITREQLFLQLHQELPYDAWVETEKWEDFENGSVKIHQVIYVARETQKSIILGKNGRQIKAISSAARHELSTLLDRSVHLFVHVKHMSDWQNRPAAYRIMGLDFQS